MRATLNRIPVDTNLKKQFDSAADPECVVVQNTYTDTHPFWIVDR